MTYTPIQQRVIDLRMALQESFNHCRAAKKCDDCLLYHQWRRTWEINYILLLELIATDEEFCSLNQSVYEWSRFIWDKVMNPSWMYKTLLWHDQTMGFEAWMTPL